MTGSIFSPPRYPRPGQTKQGGYRKYGLGIDDDRANQQMQLAFSYAIGLIFTLTDVQYIEPLYEITTGMCTCPSRSDRKTTMDYQRSAKYPIWYILLLYTKHYILES